MCGCCWAKSPIRIFSWRDIWYQGKSKLSAPSGRKWKHSQHRAKRGFLDFLPPKSYIMRGGRAKVYSIACGSIHYEPGERYYWWWRYLDFRGRTWFFPFANGNGEDIQNFAPSSTYIPTFGPFVLVSTATNRFFVARIHFIMILFRFFVTVLELGGAPSGRRPLGSRKAILRSEKPMREIYVYTIPILSL